MKVLAFEHGDRPKVWTLARRNAPQGMRALAEMLAPEGYADHALITLDWTGDMLLALSQGEVARPVMHVLVTRYHPEYDKRREVEVVVDLEDAFGNDQIDNATLKELVEHFKTELDKPVPPPSETRIYES